MKLELNVAKKILNLALSTGADFAEIFVQDETSNSIVLSNKKVERIHRDHTSGIGLRLRRADNELNGFITGFDVKELTKLTKKMIASFKGTQSVFVRNLELQHFSYDKNSVEAHSSMTLEEKIEYLKKMEKAAYDYSEEIVNVSCILLENDSHIEIYNSNSMAYTDERILTRVTCSAKSTDGNSFEVGTSSKGGAKGLELLKLMTPEERGTLAATDAVDLIHAPFCPSGTMPVIIGNGFGGTLFHEACGHPLEGSAISRNLSVFSTKLGTKIASDIVNAVDDGTLVGEWGSLRVDDEGNKPTRNVLIENGVLKSFMLDDLSSSVMNKRYQRFNPVEFLEDSTSSSSTTSSVLDDSICLDTTSRRFVPTGSCRRESYRYSPTTRMTNTFICNGEHTKEELIANTKHGLYCLGFKGGQVNPATGQFTFGASKAYLIEDGKITQLVRGASLVGYGHEVLLNIDMIANDLELGEGMCGASSGSINVCIGQPTLRISTMTVAGAGKEGE